VVRMTSRLTVVVAMLLACGTVASVFILNDALAQTAVQPPQAQTSPATPAQPPTEPPSNQPIVRDSDHGTALMLLDRVATLLDETVKGRSTKTGPVATSGSNENLGRIVVDRATLDEVRAEIAQVKLLLQDKPSSSVALRPRETIGEAR